MPKRGESKMNNVLMPTLLEITNKLQEACAEMDDSIDIKYQLPKIAVVGSQSAGKSSVLESIVGGDFLPRGDGIVTRCPLVIQLINGPEFYGEFLHKKSERFTDYEKIRKEIEKRTEELAGNGISTTEINLSIHSPNVVNLTLVDLPGLMVNAIGVAPEDIRKIKELVLKYISEENCLILAITPGNLNLASAESLNFAEEVDKMYERTIGVLTKLDIMGPGVNAFDGLENKKWPLQHGYVGVICRSQKDINDKKSIEAALESESKWIADHKEYNRFSDRMGIRNLQLLLSRKLEECIKNHLPTLQNKLQMRYFALQNEINEFKKSHPNDEEAMVKVLISILNRLTEDFRTEIGSIGGDSLVTDRPTIGSKINSILHESFPNAIASITSYDDQNHAKINKAIVNLLGILLPVYTPQNVFECLVKDEIKKLEKPIRECIKLVVEQLLEVIRLCTKNINNFPHLKAEIELKLMSYMLSNDQKFVGNVLTLNQMERAYLNTNHHDFNSAQQSDYIIQDGVLCIENLINNDGNSYRFILKSKSLTCHDYKKGVVQFMTNLDDLKVDDCNDNSKPNKHIIVVARHRGNMIDNVERLELSSENVQEINAWKEAFEKVINDQKANTKLPGVLQKFDETKRKEIDDIYGKIVNYMSIVKANTRDMVPKAIKFYIIDELENFIKIELQSPLFHPEKLAQRFAKKPELVEEIKRKENLAQACEKSLEIFRSI